VSKISNALDIVSDAFKSQGLEPPIEIHLTAEQGDQLSAEMYDLFSKQGCPRYTDGAKYLDLNLRWSRLLRPEPKLSPEDDQG